MTIGIHTEKYDVFALQVGMFISRLDIPWSATDYPLKGFLIEDQSQIEELIKLCNHVYVDRIRSQNIEKRILLNDCQPAIVFPKKRVQKRVTGGVSNARVNQKLATFGTAEYPITSSFGEEIRVAETILQDSAHKLDEILNRNKMLDRHDVLTIKHSTQKLVASAIRNPHALVWMCKIKNADKRIYSLILSSAVSGIIFGRHLALTRDKIEILAEALILRGVGLTKMDKRKLIAYRPGKETMDYFKHVDLTINALKKFAQCNGLVINTIQNHCERFDGTGYPANKDAQRIPLLAQMMGIVVFYETCINPLVDKRAVSPSAAIAQLYKVANRQFSKVMIEEFVRSTGLYPVGCLVELSDQSIAMVVEQSDSQRLRPKVVRVQNECKELLAEPELIDLFEKHYEGVNLTISRGVSRAGFGPGVLDIDPAILKPQKKIKKVWSLLKRPASSLKTKVLG